MKRFGYTLSEALVALTIIGVVAGLMIPMANKFAPDVNKALYLKTYDSVVEAVHFMASNRRLYPLITVDNLQNINCANCPLWNIDSVDIDRNGVDDVGGNQKFCQLLARAFGEENPQCSDLNLLPQNPYNGEPSFTASNGVDFWVYNSRARQGNSALFVGHILFDVDGVDKGNNCEIGQNCPRPDRFALRATSDASVFPGDEKGRLYLTLRTNLKNNSDERVMDADRIGTIQTMEDEDTLKEFEVIAD